MTSGVLIEAALRQPTIIREYTSMMNAVNTNPDHVGTYVKSDTHSWFGRSARNRRFTRSGARGEDLSGRVVIVVFERVAPRIPSSPINRETRSWSTTKPCSGRRAALIFRRPYTR